MQGRAGEGRHGLGDGQGAVAPTSVAHGAGWASWQGVVCVGGELGEQPLQQRERWGGKRVDINDSRGDSEAGTAWAESGSNSTRLNGEEIGVRVQRLVVWLAGDSGTVPRRRHPATYVDSPSQLTMSKRWRTPTSHPEIFPRGRDGAVRIPQSLCVCCQKSMTPSMECRRGREYLVSVGKDWPDHLSPDNHHGPPPSAVSAACGLMGCVAHEGANDTPRSPSRRGCHPVQQRASRQQ